jgi:hypothetical protein
MNRKLKSWAMYITGRFSLTTEEESLEIAKLRLYEWSYLLQCNPRQHQFHIESHTDHIQLHQLTCHLPVSLKKYNLWLIHWCWSYIHIHRLSLSFIHPLPIQSAFIIRSYIRSLRSFDALRPVALYRKDLEFSKESQIHPRASSSSSLIWSSI